MISMAFKNILLNPISCILHEILNIKYKHNENLEEFINKMLDRIKSGLLGGHSTRLIPTSTNYSVTILALCGFAL